MFITPERNSKIPASIEMNVTNTYGIMNITMGRIKSAMPPTKDDMAPCGISSVLRFSLKYEISDQAPITVKRNAITYTMVIIVTFGMTSNTMPAITKAIDCKIRFERNVLKAELMADPLVLL